MSITNTSKPTPAITNIPQQSGAVWDDSRYAWDDSSISWDQIDSSMSNTTKQTTSISNTSKP